MAKLEAREFRSRIMEDSVIDGLVDLLVGSGNPTCQPLWQKKQTDTESKICSHSAWRAILRGQKDEEDLDFEMQFLDYWKASILSPALSNA